MPLARGFTLLELVVALALGGLLAGLAVPASLKAMDAMAYQSAVRHLVADLRATRSQAILEGNPRRFVVNLEERRFGVTEPKRMIPDALSVELAVADSLASRGSGAIIFYPDGSSSGGSITLKRPSGAGTKVRVDWLLGEVQLIPLDAS